MTRAEGVVHGFVALQKSGKAVFLAQGIHALAPAGQNLVRVGLVADIPDQSILRGVEHIVQGDCQFDHAQPGGQMPAGLRNGVHQTVPQLGRQCRQFRRRQGTQAARRLDFVEQQVRRTGRGVGHVSRPWRG